MSVSKKNGGMSRKIITLIVWNMIRRIQIPSNMYASDWISVSKVTISSLPTCMSCHSMSKIFTVNKAAVKFHVNVYPDVVALQ